MHKQNGFTIVELMVGLAMIGILISIALPSFSDWTIRMRVDDEISQMHRLLLSTRNTAVNMELPVTICPLDDSNVCVNDWTGEISVFTNVGVGNAAPDTTRFLPANDETLVRVKMPIKDGDDLSFPLASIVYQPTGQSGGFAGTFIYCPSGNVDKNRGLIVSLRGRVYATSDTDNDGIDENRQGAELTCP
ncbi:pilus assembly FimT family protein [Thalassotalea atypica]|uniref:pilus assembly FimT family protein n=1 Tax=Thalassotalea atypica TaxID=2054316 RepID=UPI0025723EE0|nr:GspH/FimT family pseudopilin [Thalassotalea atypica]